MSVLLKEIASWKALAGYEVAVTDNSHTNLNSEITLHLQNDTRHGSVPPVKSWFLLWGSKA
jgi:hypothetical protein